MPERSRIWAEDGDGENGGYSKKKGQQEVKGTGSEKRKGGARLELRTAGWASGE